MEKINSTKQILNFRIFIFLILVFTIFNISIILASETSVQTCNQSWLDFDGINDGVVIPFINTSSELTYTFWFKRNNITITQDPFAEMNGLIRTTSTQILYWPNTDNGNKALDYTPDKNWTFIAVTHQGNKCSIYKDNSSVASFADCSTINTKNAVNNLGSYGIFNHVNGSIDDVRIFNRSLGSEAVMDIYYKQRDPIPLQSGVVVVSYHNVDNIDTTYYVNLTNFDAQMSWLNNSGYTSITYRDFVKYTQGKYILPEKPIIISFDDGSLNVYTNAFTIMKNYGFIGCANIISSLVGNAGKMSYTQIQDLSDSGWEIVSHSQTHCNFITSCNTPQDWINEFNNSKSSLEGNLTGVNITSFIYPFTTYNDTSNSYADDYYTFVGGYDWYNPITKILDYGYKHTNPIGGLDRFGLTNTTTLNMFQHAVLQNNDLKMQLNFDENSSTIAYDSSGNENHGIISGTTWNSEETCTIEYPIDQRLSILESWKQTIDIWRTTITNTINGLITKTDNQQEEINILKSRVSDLENQTLLIINGTL
ncbi:polysaccharide deacetylase family protein [archaeon]|nr:polysaccharide deacetylase family protein [archaeon]